MTGQNPEQFPSVITGTMHIVALQCSVDDLDHELVALAAGVSSPQRDVAIDVSSLGHVDDLLAELGTPGEQNEVEVSVTRSLFPHGAVATPLVPDAPAVMADPPREGAKRGEDTGSQKSFANDVSAVLMRSAAGDDPYDAEVSDDVGASEAVVGASEAVIGASEAVVGASEAVVGASEAVVEVSEGGSGRTVVASQTEDARGEDVPRRFLDFEVRSAPAEVLATVLDLPDVDFAPPSEPPSAVRTHAVASEETFTDLRPSLLQVDAAAPHVEQLVESFGDSSLGEISEATAQGFVEAPMPELGALVESMLIDEDEVMVEAAALSSTAPPPASGSSAIEPPVVVDTDAVLVVEAPVAATGTLLGVTPAHQPNARRRGEALDGDLGEIVFDLEPELEVASPTAVVSHAQKALTTPRLRDSAMGSVGSRPPPPRRRDSLDNLELDLSELSPGELRPPSLRPPPLLRPPPPPPQRAAPPPAPRVLAQRVEVDEVVELDEQEVEVLRASSRPPPAAESKAPPPVPQRSGGQK